ncbi:TetR/AcrR family transcriptional regulator [Pseudomonas sp.]|uniref:TetR/AcrR family transcriptional regulator n=1 Tax=Pseudomonas sp. TaxID=306 RepID=UPI0032423826
MSTPQQIVASALGLFYRNGFHASGVDLLSREAGVTKKTLYRHYPSKDALIEAALELRHAQFMARLRTFVEQAAVAHRPLAYIDFIADWVQEDDFCGCAFINASAEFAQMDAVPHQQAASHKQDIQAYLLALCTAAGASQPSPLATQLFLIGEGLIVGSQVQQAHKATLVEGARAAAQVIWATA